jgi:hypothetical protein
MAGKVTDIHQSPVEEIHLFYFTKPDSIFIRDLFYYISSKKPPNQNSGAVGVAQSGNPARRHPCALRSPETASSG